MKFVLVAAAILVILVLAKGGSSKRGKQELEKVINKARPVKHLGGPSVHWKQLLQESLIASLVILDLIFPIAYLK